MYTNNNVRAWESIQRGIAGICCALQIFMLLGSLEAVSLSARTTSSELNERIETLEKLAQEAAEARKQASAQYESAKEDYENLQRRKEAIDAEADAIESEAEALRQVVLGYAEQEALLNRRIAAMETELNERLVTLKERLRSEYENGKVDYFTILFTSNGLYEFLTSAERLSLLAEQDHDFIQQCEAAANALRVEKETLAGIVATAADKSAALHQAMTDLEAKQNEIVTMMADLQNDVDSYLAAIKQAEQAEAEFQAELEKKLALLAQLGNSEYQGGNFIWPLPAKYKDVSSPFGERVHPVTGKPQFHEGIDIPAPKKTEIYAVAIGTVIETGSHYANGKYVIVDHGGGITTTYSHLNRINVKKGDILAQGDILGLVGISGWTTGYHLDFSVYVDGKAVDPMTYLPH